MNIPFKREGVSQVNQVNEELSGRRDSFNSLQTGRCITRTKIIADGSWKVTVSIPFKREGVSQAGYPKSANRLCEQCFNSLQTGRCITSFSVFFSLVFVSSTNVSIPFKREGVSQEVGMALMLTFPISVSIPFKREGVSQDPTPRNVKAPSTVSIPFKREGVSQVN